MMSKMLQSIPNNKIEKYNKIKEHYIKSKKRSINNIEKNGIIKYNQLQTDLKTKIDKLSDIHNPDNFKLLYSIVCHMYLIDNNINGFNDRYDEDIIIDKAHRHYYNTIFGKELCNENIIWDNIEFNIESKHIVENIMLY